MAFEQLTENVKGISDNIQEYSKNTAEYYKLDLFKKSMQGATKMARFAVLGVVGSIALFFISIAVAIWIGETIGNQSYGYLIVGGFYVLVFTLIYAFAKTPIEKLMLRKFSALYFNDKIKDNESIQ